MTEKKSRSETEASAQLPARPAPVGRTLLLAGIVFTVVLSGVLSLMNRDAASYTGYLQAHAVPIKAPFTARLESILIEEGESVTPNEPLFSLRDNDLVHRRELKQRQIAALKTELERARAQAKIDLAEWMKKIENELLETRLKQANLLKEQFSHEIEDIAWSEYSSDPIEMASLNGAQAGSFSFSSAKRDDPKMEVLLRRAAAQNANEVISSQVELCQRRMLELEELKQTLPRDVEVAAGVESLERKLDETESAYQELLSQLQAQEVKSPGYGLVGLFEFLPGQTVEEGELIVRLFDKEQLFITVDVPSHDVHRFQQNEKLKLGFPSGDQTYGRIVKIAPHVVSAGHPGALPVGQTMVRLWMEPADGLWPEAPIGSQIEVSR